MTITLEVSPEQETQLRQRVAHRDAEAVRQLLMEAVEPTVAVLLRETTAEVADEEFEALADELAAEWAAAADPEALPLPDEALTRAGIYRDHP